MAQNYIDVNGEHVTRWFANNQELSAIYANNVEIFRPESEITPLFNVNDYYHPNGAYQQASKSGDNIILNASSSLLRNIWSDAIDLSRFNTLSITLSISKASGEPGFNATRWFYILRNSTNTSELMFHSRIVPSCAEDTNCFPFGLKDNDVIVPNKLV